MYNNQGELDTRQQQFTQIFQSADDSSDNQQKITNNQDDKMLNKTNYMNQLEQYHQIMYSQKGYEGKLYQNQQRDNYQEKNLQKQSENDSQGSDGQPYPLVMDNQYELGREEKYQNVIRRITDQIRLDQNKSKCNINIIEDNLIDDENFDCLNIINLKTQKSKKQLQKQFEQVRFNQQQYNLIDLHIPNSIQKPSYLIGQQNNYQYQQFLQNRLISIQQPILINDGLIISYKLYQIRSKKQNTACYDTCVMRRFSDFEYLNELLVEEYGGYIIPILPEKNFWASINLQGKQYKQIRTRSLQKYLNRLLRHKRLRVIKQVREFLFLQNQRFSVSKGEFSQKKNHIQDRLKLISQGAIQYGKYFYQKILQLSTGDNINQNNNQNNKFSNFTSNDTNQLIKSGCMKSNLLRNTKQDLKLQQYQLVIIQLLRIVKYLKVLVQNTIQQIQRVYQLKGLFNLELVDKSKKKDNRQGISESFCIVLENSELFQEYEQLCQFIQSCSCAIYRRNQLKKQIYQLASQEQSLKQKYRSSPRNVEVDLVRARLGKLKKMQVGFTTQLIKELQIHADEGKGMLKRFIVNFQKIKAGFYADQDM